MRRLFFIPSGSGFGFKRRRGRKKRKKRKERKKDRKMERRYAPVVMRQAERPTGFEPTLVLKIGYAPVMRRV